MPIHVTAHWKCRPGSEELVRDALKEFVTAVRENEPQTRIYTALQQEGDPAACMTYFIFENDAARAFHRSTEWVRKFTDQIYPENLEPVVSPNTA